MSHLVEPIEVLRRDEAPAHFLWRGGLYVVRDVLDQWTETEPWREAAAGLSAAGEAVGGGGAAVPVARRAGGFQMGFASHQPAAASAGQPTPAGGAGGSARDRLNRARATAESNARARRTVDVDGFEHQIWRVAASRGRRGPIAEYDLRRTWPGGGWSVVCPTMLAYPHSGAGVRGRSA